jgi:2-oxoisovalerate dehydrogenase E1 component
VTSLPHQPRPARARKAERPDPRFAWRRIAYTALVSRALDDIEEATNRNKATVPREHLVLYQFSARGHEVGESILGSLIDHPHDAASAYYRSRPLLLALGLSIEDAFASPLGRAGGFSDGRDIGVVCNLPTPNGPIVMPMSGDVGSQYTPCAGWAQSIRYHADVLSDAAWNGAMGVVLGGEGSVATNGFWSALTIATTLKLPMLFYIEDNGLGISVKGDLQTPGGNVAQNLASFDMTGYDARHAEGFIRLFGLPLATAARRDAESRPGSSPSSPKPSKGVVRSAGAALKAPARRKARVR